MGFEFEGNVYNLTFETPSHKGLQVRATSVPIGDFRRLVKLAVELQGQAEKPAAKRQFTPEQIEALDGLIEGFAEALESWNLEKKGVPVPPTPEGLAKQPFEFLFPVITAWITAVGGVDEGSDLGKGSLSGVTFPEPRPQMEQQLSNLSSLTTPS